jgi:hypothetical protein
MIMFFNRTEPAEEEPFPEPEPIDVHQFIDNGRRQAEESALRIANMIAEEFYGVVEPINTPVDDLGSSKFILAPRCYRVSTGEMRFYVQTYLFETSDHDYNGIKYDNISDYQKSVYRTDKIRLKIAIAATTRVFDPVTETFSWKKTHSQDWGFKVADPDSFYGVFTEKDAYRIRDWYSAWW